MLNAQLAFTNGDTYNIHKLLLGLNKVVLKANTLFAKSMA